MYTTKNFRSKKALKDAVAAGEQVDVFQFNDMWGKTQECRNAPRMTVFLEGPHYPEAHKWYAQAITEYGIVKEVK
jgi:hypothetical protein